MDCFMNRYDLSNHRKTTVSQHLPEDLLEKQQNESKLPPVIIFKLKNIPQKTFSNGIFVRVNAKGWVNEDKMIL
ncbi:204_t:CDS:2 [Funneliformis geosporum]|nr:204_t:CDS:2 [Funneliformis geosporum]